MERKISDRVKREQCLECLAWQYIGFYIALDGCTDLAAAERRDVCVKSIFAKRSGIYLHERNTEAGNI